ncbi:uncharacterized protein LOC124452462 isoform X2 [Xenia sp. Carnegie-2017]|nr:uncharacterized protein LOC124452462 isoform X2 [Xenia sp. Carnegie-2017]
MTSAKDFIAYERCPPFCENNCPNAGDHHRLLVAILNSHNDHGFKKFCKRAQQYLKEGWKVDDPIEDINCEYRYPLIHWATVLGKTKVLKWCVRNGVDLMKKHGRRSETALHRLMICGYTPLREKCHDIPKRFKKIVNILKDLLSVKNDNRDLPIHVAAKVLVERPLVNDPLFKMTYTEMLKILVDMTADVDQELLNYRNVDGDTIMHILAKHDRGAEIIDVLGQMDADFTLINAEGQKPIDIAREADAADVLELLTDEEEHADDIGDVDLISISSNEDDDKKDYDSIKNLMQRAKIESNIDTIFLLEEEVLTDSNCNVEKTNQDVSDDSLFSMTDDHNRVDMMLTPSLKTTSPAINEKSCEGKTEAQMNSESKRKSSTDEGTCKKKVKFFTDEGKERKIYPKLEIPLNITKCTSVKNQARKSSATVKIAPVVSGAISNSSCNDTSLISSSRTLTTNSSVLDKETSSENASFSRMYDEGTSSSPGKLSKFTSQSCDERSVTIHERKHEDLLQSKQMNLTVVIEKASTTSPSKFASGKHNSLERKTIGDSDKEDLITVKKETELAVTTPSNNESSLLAMEEGEYIPPPGSFSSVENSSLDRSETQRSNKKLENVVANLRRRAEKANRTSDPSDCLSSLDSAARDEEDKSAASAVGVNDCLPEVSLTGKSSCTSKIFQCSNNQCTDGKTIDDDNRQSRPTATRTTTNSNVQEMSLVDEGDNPRRSNEHERSDQEKPSNVDANMLSTPSASTDKTTELLTKETNRVIADDNEHVQFSEEFLDTCPRNTSTTNLNAREMFSRKFSEEFLDTCPRNTTATNSNVQEISLIEEKGDSCISNKPDYKDSSDGNVNTLFSPSVNQNKKSELLKKQRSCGIDYDNESVVISEVFPNTCPRSTSLTNLNVREVSLVDERDDPSTSRGHEETMYKNTSNVSVNNSSSPLVSLRKAAEILIKQTSLRDDNVSAPLNCEFPGTLRENIVRSSSSLFEPSRAIPAVEDGNKKSTMPGTVLSTLLKSERREVSIPTTKLSHIAVLEKSFYAPCDGSNNTVDSQGQKRIFNVPQYGVGKEFQERISSSVPLPRNIASSLSATSTDPSNITNNHLPIPSNAAFTTSVFNEQIRAVLSTAPSQLKHFSNSVSSSQTSVVQSLPNLSTRPIINTNIGNHPIVIGPYGQYVQFLVGHQLGNNSPQIVSPNVGTRYAQQATVDVNRADISANQGLISASVTGRTFAPLRFVAQPSKNTVQTCTSTGIDRSFKQNLTTVPTSSSHLSPWRSYKCKDVPANVLHARQLQHLLVGTSSTAQSITTRPMFTTKSCSPTVNSTVSFTRVPLPSLFQQFDPKFTQPRAPVQAAPNISSLQSQIYRQPAPVRTAETMVAVNTFPHRQDRASHTVFNVSPATLSAVSSNTTRARVPRLPVLRPDAMTQRNNNDYLLFKPTYQSSEHHVPISERRAFNENVVIIDEALRSTHLPQTKISVTPTYGQSQITIHQHQEFNAHAQVPAQEANTAHYNKSENKNSGPRDLSKTDNVEDLFNYILGEKNFAELRLGAEQNTLIQFLLKEKKEKTDAVRQLTNKMQAAEKTESETRSEFEVLQKKTEHAIDLLKEHHKNEFTRLQTELKTTLKSKESCQKEIDEKNEKIARINDVLTQIGRLPRMTNRFS